jgi:membrane protein DedA with SNARE-associated domain
MCYMAGLGRMSAQRFLIANMLGRGIASFITALVGAYGSQIPVQVWVGAGVLILLGLPVWQIAKRVPNPFVKGGSNVNA